MLLVRVRLAMTKLVKSICVSAVLSFSLGCAPLQVRDVRGDHLGGIPATTKDKENPIVYVNGGRSFFGTTTVEIKMDAKTGSVSEIKTTNAAPKDALGAFGGILGPLLVPLLTYFIGDAQ